MRGGNPAVVNVFLTGSPTSTTAMRIVLRLFTVGGGLVYSDTVTTHGTIGASVDPGAPNAQFLVPTAQLTAGLTWQVARDPTGAVPDDSAANDVYPRGGAPQPLSVVDVPPLTIRFVPIVLAANGGTTPSLPSSIFADYLRTLKSVHPLGAVSTHVGATFSTSASFGTPPNGGDSPFWTALISQLDLARIADPVEPDVNWFGVVLPPPGFTFTAFGGFSYIPASGSATGPNTRTGSGVGPGWFARPTQARDLVAHEIGHSFGRRHAPCGGAAPPLDPGYPIPGGTLDATGFDVYAWANGLAPAATAVATSTGDVMGYCFPVWASTYTYKAVLAFRQSAVVASRGNVSAPERQRVVVVRGSVTDAGAIALEPVFTLDARPTIPDLSGAYTVRGVSSEGRTLFSARVDAAEIDHAPGTRHFTLALPTTSDIETSLDTVVVIGRGGRATMTRAATVRIATADVRASATTRASGGVGVSCGAGAHGVVALDAGGTVVAVSSTGSTSIDAAATGAGALTVLCSDGLRTTRVSGVLPIVR